jgi:FkbM family methyltransferase
MRARRTVRRAVFGPNRTERYDIETVEVLRRVLQKDDVCIDLGANNGEILKEMLAFAPAGRHHAVEAIPHLADKLIEQFPSVVVHSCAVSDTTGEQTFHFVEDDPAYSGLRRRIYPRADFEVRPITVPVRRLDDLVPLDIVVRLIKADIEGGEYHAFLGARRILELSKPYVIFEFGAGATGFYGVSAEMMYTLLEGDAGLSISTMQRWLNGQPPLTCGEFQRSYEEGTDLYFLAYPRPAS